MSPFPATRHRSLGEGPGPRSIQALPEFPPAVQTKNTAIQTKFNLGSPNQGWFLHDSVTSTEDVSLFEVVYLSNQTRGFSRWIQFFMMFAYW